MFRLHKQKSEYRSGERIEFKFSSFQALQVPKGWDRLLVSFVSVETGKTISKLGKSSVRNGNCRWTESLSESTWISREQTECLFKFVVALGSSRSGILGEATVNLAAYASSKASIPLSLPLENCSFGTTLQFKIQCLTPRAKHREEGTNVHSRSEYANAEHDDMEYKSDASDSAFSRSVGSNSSNHLDTSSQPGELGSRDPSFSASGSRHSVDSVGGSSVKDISSPQSNSTGVANNYIGRQDSTGSQNSMQSYSSHGLDDANRSNHSSFSSKIQGQVSPSQNQREESVRSSSAYVSSPLHSADSSKDLLEAAEVRIEELRTEARMWERNARKSMLDVEALKKELSEQSKNQETLDMELSASYRQCDGLKQEIEQLKILLEESTMKQKTTAEMKLHAMDADKLQKELEDEIKFHKEANASLEEQLQKTQESNIELLSILQELEGIVEAQKKEIVDLSAQKEKLEEKYRHGNEDNDVDSSKIQLQNLLETQKELEKTIQILEKTLEDRNEELEMEQSFRSRSLLDCESMWRCKLAAKEEEIASLQEKLSEAVKDREHEMSDAETDGNTNLTNEVEFLRGKVEDLEKDCIELTEENLQLLMKLKECKKDFLPSDSFLESYSGPAIDSSSISQDEVGQLKSQLQELQEELKKQEVLIEELSTSDRSMVECIDLENKCNDLEIQLQTFQDKALDLEDDLEKCRVQVKEQLVEICALQQQLQFYKENETTKGDPQESEQSLNSPSHSSSELFNALSELREQLHGFLALVKEHRHSLNFPVDSKSVYCFDHSELKCTEPVTQEEQVEVTLKYITQLYKLFEACYDQHDNKLHSTEEDTGARGQGCISNQVAQSSVTALECKSIDLSKELAVKVTEMEALKSVHVLKEEEIAALRQKQTELETQISSLLKERSQLEESIEIMSREKSEASKCLEELKNETLLLNSSLESQGAENKVLQRQSSVLEKGKQDLEVLLAELEQENMQLSERISAMESQLRYVTNEKESCRLELQHSEHQANDLNDEISRLEREMEAQKIDMKQKLQDMQKRWLEAQEECEYLKKSNQTLQATTENLIEECTSIQKSNADMKRQNIELHTRCTALEAQLNDLRERFCKCSEKVEVLDTEYSSMLEQIVLKEESLKSELESLSHENGEHKDKLLAQESLLNQMYADKVLEVENLQGQLVHLIDQIYAVDDEKDKISSEAILELSTLRSDKVKLEVALQELQEKLASSENHCSSLQMQSEVKVQELMAELSASRQTQEFLMADHEKLLVLLDSLKSSEERCKGFMSGLEMNLKVSEFERRQLAEEISSLKDQLQRAALLQDEVLALKSSLNEAKFENEKMKASFDLLCGDHEELKTEKFSLVQKISTMDNALLELEECQRGKIALEEKILRLEGDLNAREALCAQDAELKIELSRVKRANSELQQKIKHLEEDRQEWLKRVQALQDELKQKKEALQHMSQLASMTSDVNVEPTVSISGTHDDEKLSGMSHKQQMDASTPEVDYSSKRQSLKNKPAGALEVNDMYKSQLTRILSDGKTNDLDTPHISRNENGADEKHGSIVSALELELRDLRERYLQLSLKHAEVEAQREELVMKLKSTNNRRRWFS
ncbi:hypothetical protein Ancab_001257 [Ancistrocladus abbreviatus]